MCKANEYMLEERNYFSSKYSLQSWKYIFEVFIIFQKYRDLFKVNILFNKCFIFSVYLCLQYKISSQEIVTLNKLMICISFHGTLNLENVLFRMNKIFRCFNLKITCPINPHIKHIFTRIIYLFILKITSLTVYLIQPFKKIPVQLNKLTRIKRLSFFTVQKTLLYKITKTFPLSIIKLKASSIQAHHKTSTKTQKK